MAIKFDKIWNSVKKGAGTAKDLAELRIKYARERATLDKLYKKLGMISYDGFINEKENDTTDICAKISLTLGNISAVKNEIRRIEGINECRNCGKGLTKKYTYCPFCGEKIDDIPEFPEEDISVGDAEDIENIEAAPSSDENAASEDNSFFDCDTKSGDDANSDVEATDIDESAEISANNTSEYSENVAEEIFNIDFSSDEQ